jgi:hypothetical protein
VKTPSMFTPRSDTAAPYWNDEDDDKHGDDDEPYPTTPGSAALLLSPALSRALPSLTPEQVEQTVVDLTQVEDDSELEQRVQQLTLEECQRSLMAMTLRLRGSNGTGPR